MNEDTIIKSIAVLEANYNNLSEKIDKISDKLDALAADFQKFGGLYSQQEMINGRINKLENWKDAVETTIIKCDECQRVKGDTGSRAKDVIWELLKMALVAGIVLAGSAIWTQYFVR
jgi:hypothetical protein